MKDKSLESRMKNCRKKYGASKTLMSKVCGFGVNGWSNYEKSTDNIERSNALLIFMAITPYGMMKLLEMCTNSMKDQPEYKRTYMKVYHHCELIRKVTEQEHFKLTEKLNIDFSYDGI